MLGILVANKNGMKNSKKNSKKNTQVTEENEDDIDVPEFATTTAKKYRNQSEKI